MTGVSDAVEIRRRLAELSPEIPWAHYFDLHGVPTISPEKDEKFFRKSQGVTRLAELALHLARSFSEKRSVAGSRILDVASGEGALSFVFAKAGAGEVIGVEGRDLYIQRSRFVAATLGVSGVSFKPGDVRNISVESHGVFDVTLCFGILHHLGKDDFLPFLMNMASVTQDMLVLYTHVATPTSLSEYALSGPVSASGYEGYLLREHAEGATTQQKIDQVRASLDNTFSFWATEESLLRALKRVGFNTVVKVYEPHVFGDYAKRNFRPIIVAKKTG
jgi:SAM-dependent methyltransferase